MPIVILIESFLGDILPKSLLKETWMKSTASAVLIAIAGLSVPASAQLTTLQSADQELNLASNSPFRDPDIIYLEADTLINDEAAQLLTATGQVEGRYQDKTLRADNVLSVSYTHLTLPTKA